ncbi:MAG: TlpA disulfide reductase family protein [Luteolibacter sp.]
MNPRLTLFALASLAILGTANAGPAEAERAEKTYQQAMEQWAQTMSTATTPEARAAAEATRPDAANAARQVWQAIGTSLDQEWALDHAAWFLEITSQPNSSPSQAFAKERNSILAAVESKHLQSNQLTRLCHALTFSPDPRSISLLDKIQTTNPDPKIQGIAALCYAISLKTLGDEPDIMRKRLTALRKAIIQSPDMEINGTPVLQIAEDELYLIRYLTKGRIAPDLQGTDSANRSLSLSSHAGKVIVLLFWNSNMPEGTHVVEITNRLVTKFRDKPFVVLGVNGDALETLRSLEGANTVTWRNFSDPSRQLTNEYRVAAVPFVYVLDGERKIHYAGAPGSFAELTAEALLAESKPAEAVPTE